MTNKQITNDINNNNDTIYKKNLQEKIKTKQANTRTHSTHITTSTKNKETNKRTKLSAIEQNQIKIKTNSLAQIQCNITS